MSVGLILAASGCGGGTSTIKKPVVAQASAAPRPAAAAPVLHLSILSPRVGAHTSSTLTVRAAIIGARTAAARGFHYVLDHRLTRSGSDRLTFHNLAPGRHRLEVTSAGASPSPATTTFTVRAPAPVAVSAAQPQPTVSTPAPPPTSTTPPPRAPAPSEATTTPAPPQASPPQPSGGIPQGANAGDGDGDNSGGPSDGDGNV